MAFNDYFGYEFNRNARRPSRKLRRTEFSLQKLADLSDSKSNKKTMIGEIFKRKKAKNNILLHSNKRSLRHSPFRGIEKKHKINHQQHRKKKTNNDNLKATYDRFFSEQCKVKKIVVEEKKDSMIRQYFARKKQEHQFQNKLQKKFSPISKTQQNIKQIVSQNTSFSFYKNQNQYQFNPPSNPLTPKKQKLQQSTAKPYQDRKIFLQSNILFNEEQDEDCIFSPNEEDDYQMKKTPSMLQISKNQDGKSLLQKKLQKACRNGTLIKIQTHLQKIKKIINFVQQTISFRENHLEIYERQNYLMKRMFFQQMKKAMKTLKGKENIKNCFILDDCKIEKLELKVCRKQNTSELQIKVKEIERQVKVIEDNLKKQSKKLITNEPNDPYLRLQKQNFQPELVSELYEEINSICQKLCQRRGVTNREKEEERRYKLLCIVFLIGQICEMKDNAPADIEANNYNKFYQDNQFVLVDMVQRFQDMPL